MLGLKIVDITRHILWGRGAPQEAATSDREENEDKLEIEFMVTSIEGPIIYATPCFFKCFQLYRVRRYVSTS
jgi:hypothetical protein